MPITISAKSADMRRGYVMFVFPIRPPPPSSVYGFDAFKVGFSDFFLSSPNLKAQLSFSDNLLSFVCPSVSLSVFLGKGEMSLFKWWASLDSEKANYIHWRHLIILNLTWQKAHTFKWMTTSFISGEILAKIVIILWQHLKIFFWGGAKPQGQF